MSRGGRGGSRGGARKDQPDLGWDDDDSQPLPVNRPPPTFPRLELHVPRPLDKTENASVDKYLSFRDRTRNGPYFAILDPSSLTDDRGKVDKRAGFDPFNDQEGYSGKFKQKKRTEPDFSNNQYPLQFFPKELWPLLDPKRRNPLWKTLDDNDKLKSRKRKRKMVQPAEEEQRERDSDEDSDAVITGRRNAEKSRKKDPTKSSTQKRGLDAEDDYPDDQNDDEDGEENDEPEDSEFDEDDEDADDYNAEQYFEDGEDDDFGDDGGGDGGGDEGYY